MTKTVLLGDICHQITDGAHWSPQSTDDGYPMASVKDMLDYGFNVNSCRKISAEDYEKLVKAGCRPERNDVLIAKDGSYLKHLFVANGKDDIVLLSSIAIIKPNLNFVDPQYLVYYIRNQRDNHDLSQYVSGAAIPRIILKSFARMPVELPSLEVQQKIVNQLRALDEKIELNRKMNETLEQMGQALFRHYFIDNPEAEKWEEKTIGELCNVKIGRTPPRKESEWFDKNSGEAWVSIKDMGQSSTFISDSSEYLTEGAVAKFNIPAIEPDTLLLSFKLTVGRLCISTKRMYSNEAIAQLPIVDDSISIEYLYYFLRNFNYQSLSSTSSIATAVNSTTVKNIKVTVPGAAAMSEFSSRAHDILEAVKNNEAEIQTLTTLRDTLLPRLINGKTKI